MMYKLLMLLMISGWMGCQDDSSQGDIPSEQSSINSSPILTKDYWYDGTGEINTYQLKQNRYNTTHEGQAIVIYVSENFLTDKQVKDDRGTKPNSTSVLKKIEQRKFTTGVYDYTLYSNVFTPFELDKYKKSLKVTGSSQEWCGTIFTQLNAKEEEEYEATRLSYFEAEGDQKAKIKKGIPEAELFTRIRFNPDLLPQGTFDIIPDPIIGMMKHYPLQSFEATATRDDYKGELQGNNLRSYTVHMPALDRVLKIIYEGLAPFKIIAWYDSYPSAFDQKIRTTEALLINQTKLDYWNKNNPEDQALRKMLKIK